jgi:predicted MPP superfamily phosphohydrolase
MVRYLFPILLLLPQVFLLYRFLRWHRATHRIPKPLALAVIGLFAVFNAGLFSTMFLRIWAMRYSEWFVYWIVYPFLFWHASTFLIAFVLLVGSLIRLPFAAIWAGLKKLPATRRRASAIAQHPGVVQFDAARRRFLTRSVYGLTAASFGGTAYGMILGNRDCDTNEREIFIPGLPHEWNGCSIALVTDIHSSLYMSKKDMDEYVKRINDLGTDFVAVGGDMVNSAVEEIYPFAEAFCKLKAPLGVYGVLGNHDFYSRDPEKVASVSEEAGIRMLRDRLVVLRKGNTPLNIIGIDDTGSLTTIEKKIQHALAGVTEPAKNILLCHRPYFLDHAQESGIDLMLSGHTHGGQVVLGRFGSTAFTPAALVSPYVSGYYSKGTAQMYVSRGIGTVAVPVRINCPPEITRIVLRPA